MFLVGLSFVGWAILLGVPLGVGFWIAFQFLDWARNAVEMWLWRKRHAQDNNLDELGYFKGKGELEDAYLDDEDDEGPLDDEDLAFVEQLIEEGEGCTTSTSESSTSSSSE